MMRISALMLLPLAVAACTPSVPNSGGGVGFQDYNAYMQQRDGGYAGAQTAMAPPAAQGFSTESIGAALDRVDPGSNASISYDAPYGAGQPQTGAMIGAQQQYMPPVAPVASSSAPPPVVDSVGHSTISDEQNFAAVSARETIQSDKARIERNRAQYQVIQPGALPTRTGSNGPNIVQFALATNHPKGAQMYSRGSFGYGSWINKCGGYASPDLAQEAFLAKGGPNSDSLKLDPDGDGYACAWDPSPFRMR